MFSRISQGSDRGAAGMDLCNANKYRIIVLLRVGGAFEVAG